MKIIPILAISATVLISCQKEKPSEKITNTAPVETVTETVPVPVQPAEATPALIQNATPTTNTQSVAPGMNPAHGQPGHRCDIAVGAPLNGKAPAAKATTQTVTTQPNNQQFQVTPGNATVTKTVTPNSNPTVTTTPTPIAQTTEPGMQGKPNPAHGQPGHRCDVPTGQPLP